MNKNLILVIEDDRTVRNLIATTLELQHYKFILAENGENGIMQALSYHPDVILLDLGLPDIDGVDIIKKVRLWSNVPIIVVSARSDDEDKISALDAGADDYITKPFSVDELLARLRVNIRRLKFMHNLQENDESIYQNGDLKINYNEGCVYICNEEIDLTPIEYKVLCLLAKNQGKILTHTYITREIWGSAWDNDIASLRVCMSNLRKKVEKHPNAPQYIQTHIGIGYRMIKVE